MPTTIRPEVGGRPINLAYPCIAHLARAHLISRTSTDHATMFPLAVAPHTWSAASAVNYSAHRLDANTDRFDQATQLPLVHLEPRTYVCR